MSAYPKISITNSSKTELAFLKFIPPNSDNKINPKTFLPQYKVVGQCAPGKVFTYAPQQSLEVIKVATSNIHMPIKQVANNVVSEVDVTISDNDVCTATTTFNYFRDYEGDPSAPLAKSINDILLNKPAKQQAGLLNDYFKSVSAGFDYLSWLSITGWAETSPLPYVGTYYVYLRKPPKSYMPITLPKVLAKVEIANDGSISWNEAGDSGTLTKTPLTFAKNLKLTSNDKDNTTLSGVFQGKGKDVELYFIGTSAGQEVIAQVNKIPTTSIMISVLAKNLGFTWPSSIPDIELAYESAKEQEGSYELWAEIDLKAQAKTSLIWKNLMNIVGQNTLVVNVAINALEIKLTGYLDTIFVPGFGLKPSMSFSKPQVELSVMPAFKFLVAKIIGQTQFTIFGETLDVTASMVIDNLEANIGLEIKGEHGSLPSPPILKGIHFDKFGAEMGLFFKPPGLDVGVTGAFHIGDKPQMSGKDDSFGIVLNVEGEVIKPEYLSFYVAQLNINEVVEIFTNSHTDINFLVSFSDLSFYWSEEPVVLPDGTLSPLGLGFSANIDVVGFDFYGQFKLDLTNGLSAKAETSPLSLGSILTIKGDGKGVTEKVDSAGNQVKNNKIIQKDKDLTTKTLVKPGGPVVTINSSGSPYFHMDFQLSLLDLENVSLTCTIDDSGISFDLDYGSVLQDKMTCTMKDWDDFKGKFSFGIDKTISLPVVSSIGLGNIHLQALIDCHMSLADHEDDVSTTLGGGFDFEGLSLTIPDFTLNVNISSITDLLDKIEEEVEKEAANIFGPVLGDVGKWAAWVSKGIISGVENMAKVLKGPFEQTLKDATQIMQSVGLPASTVASGLSSAYNASSEVVAGALQGAGYTADEVASGIGSAYNLGAEGVEAAMKGAGYTTKEIGDALQYVFKGVHVDISTFPPHGDASQHIDTPAGPHADSHLPPHGDTSPHVDTPSGPHVDTNIPPHVDGSLLGVHGDTPSVHGDTRLPPHGDVSQHIDTPAGPHADSNVPPHGDTTPHVDTPSGHIDIKP